LNEFVQHALGAELKRMTQHGILTTTVRQTVMEWSLAAPNEELARRLRAMLDQ
jgi:hypothetical protein